MAKSQDGAPAFPVPATSTKIGMSLRDYFAAKAMQALLTVGTCSPETAKRAYQMADWMLEARNAD